MGGRCVARTVHGRVATQCQSATTLQYLACYKTTIIVIVVVVIIIITILLLADRLEAPPLCYLLLAVGWRRVARTVRGPAHECSRRECCTGGASAGVLCVFDRENGGWWVGG